MKDGIEKPGEIRDSVNGNEQIGQDLKGQTGRHQGVEPQHQPGSGGVHRAGGVQEKKCQQYKNYGKIKYFFHHIHIYERQEAVYEQIS